ncbi:MAG: polysaccharide biosynthesis protein, partial [Gammaproteobacteria bacterium]|nr:polysaccharide biosynthesis protein [Gammaproteobacteria bacterium]
MDEKTVRNGILSLPRSAKQALMLGADTVGLVASILLATWLLASTAISFTTLAILIGTTFVVSVLSARHEGFYHSIVRYVGMDLAVSGVKVALLAALTIGFAAQFAGVGIHPVKLAVCFSGFFLLYLLGSRYAAQYLLNRRNPERERVIVYGAGEAGARLVLSLQDGDSFLPVAVVDDKTMLQGNRVGGILVHPRQNLEKLIEEFDVTRVLLALPSASRRRRLTIISSLEKLNVHIQTIPDLNHLVSGKARVNDLRDVDVADLLGRDPVPPDNKLLRKSVTDKCVMVTGAGGSIGSELCRHVLRQHPKTLVLF